MIVKKLFPHVKKYRNYLSSIFQSFFKFHNYICNNVRIVNIPTIIVGMSAIIY